MGTRDAALKTQDCLLQAATILGIRVLDHIVVAKADPLVFKSWTSDSLRETRAPLQPLPIASMYRRRIV